MFHSMNIISIKFYTMAITSKSINNMVISRNLMLFIFFCISNVFKIIDSARLTPGKVIHSIIYQQNHFSFFILQFINYILGDMPHTILNKRSKG